MMTNKMRRAIISLVIFVFVYITSDFMIGVPSYNAYVKSIEFLAAVIAAGCYWIGSRPADKE